MLIGDACNNTYQYRITKIWRLYYGSRRVILGRAMFHLAAPSRTLFTDIVRKPWFHEFDRNSGSQISSLQLRGLHFTTVVILDEHQGISRHISLFPVIWNYASFKWMIKDDFRCFHCYLILFL